jgi:hypothetical protein
MTFLMSKDGVPSMICSRKPGVADAIEHVGEDFHCVGRMSGVSRRITDNDFWVEFKRRAEENRAKWETLYSATATYECLMEVESKTSTGWVYVGPEQPVGQDLSAFETPEDGASAVGQPDTGGRSDIPPAEDVAANGGVINEQTRSNQPDRTYSTRAEQREHPYRRPGETPRAGSPAKSNKPIETRSKRGGKGRGRGTGRGSNKSPVVRRRG